MELVREKQFPENYSKAVLEILNAMSMTGLKKFKVVGSSNVRSMLYAGDYDCIERVDVKSIDEVVSGLRDVVKRLRVFPETYITDIKCGEESDWDVFRKTARVEDGRVVDFHIKESQTVVDVMRSGNVISPAEAKEVLKPLEDATSAVGFLHAKKSIRFHILRWKPIDILNGVLDYRGKSFVLEEAIKSGGLLKMDVVSNVDGRFTEFSCIYDIFSGGKRITSPPVPLVRGLTEDIIYFDQISPFKALKRLFSLAKHFKEIKVIEMLVPILNGDLGRLYQMVGDLKTLEDILDRPSAPVKEIRAQIDETRQRLGNIYQLNGILAHEHKLIGEIESVLKQPTPKLSAKLTGLIEAMEDLLDKETKKVISPKDVKVGAGMPRGNKPAGFVGLMIAKKKLGRTPNFYVPPAQEKNTPELFDADLIQEPSRYIKEEMYEYSTRVRQGIQKLKDIKNKSAIQKFALKYKEYFGANKDDVAKFITQYKRNDVVGAVYSANSAVGGIMFLYLMKKYKNDCFIAQYDKDYQRFKEGIHFNGKKFSVPLADLRKDMKECIKKPSNKLIVIPLTLEATTKKQKKAGSHQNMLIYRVEQNTLERYEPHGVATGATEALGYSNEVTDTAVRDLFKEKLKEITERAGVPEFRYLASADLHLKKNFDAVKPAWDGFQAIENREQQTRKLDYDGFCMAWSYFYLELVLKFPAESGQTLVNRAEALLNKEGAVRVLQHILGYVENMEKEIGDLMKAVGKSSFKFQTFRDLSARPRPAGAEDAYWEWIDWYNRQIKWFMFSDARRARLSKEGRGITVGCCDGKDEVESME